MNIKNDFFFRSSSWTKGPICLWICIGICPTNKLDTFYYTPLQVVLFTRKGLFIISFVFSGLHMHKKNKSHKYVTKRTIPIYSDVPTILVCVSIGICPTNKLDTFTVHHYNLSYLKRFYLKRSFVSFVLCDCICIKGKKWSGLCVLTDFLTRKIKFTGTIKNFN